MYARMHPSVIKMQLSSAFPGIFLHVSNATRAVNFVSLNPAAERNKLSAKERSIGITYE